MDAALRLLRELVAVNSINPTLVPGAPGEGQIADVVAVEMGKAGLDVTVEMVAPGRPNVVGVLNGRSKGRTLMFCGHTDTVGVDGMDGPFQPVERDGRLYGRGAQDMKGGVAAMIDAARLVAARGFDSGRLIVAAIVDEEHSSIGADALVKTWTADGAIVTEPTDLAIAIGHKGFAWIEIEVLGKAAHGSRPAEGLDAILRLGRVLTRLEALDRALQARPPHPLMGTGSLHASIVTGGRELSSYPDRATLQMERRTLPSEAGPRPMDEVSQILRDLEGEDRTFEARATPMFSRPGYEVARDHELPKALGQALTRAGGALQITGASFWTDAAVLGHAGIPSILFGPGGAGLHSTVEYVNVADILSCRDTLVELALTYC
ncbi:MAG TPA: ArgE/DapE family deacylase [Vicinamibacterales bacterium]|jgi:acetylornithine deacetylase|nr:ArgE/DapE family deacylase [Vicinamibacterales bacterium]